MMETLWGAIGGYLLGSIPVGFLLVRWKKNIDIRTVGSGNIGATNVTRVLGKPWGVSVAIFDMAKGGVLVLMCKYLLGMDPMALTVIGIASVLGHNFPVWLRFKGGKGVSTTYGVLFALCPLGALLSGAVWYVTMRITKYVSVASMASVCLAPFFMKLLGSHPYYVYGGVILAFLVLIRHKSNIRNLIEGKELKVGNKR